MPHAAEPLGPPAVLDRIRSMAPFLPVLAANLQLRRTTNESAPTCTMRESPLTIRPMIHRRVRQLCALVWCCSSVAVAQRVAPGARVGHALVFDESIGAVVLVDGYLSGRARPAPGSQPEWTELWAWRGARWEMLADSGLRPRARGANSVVYDARRRTIVSYGGTTIGQDPRREVETWEWNGRSWRMIADSGLCSRNHQAAVYDAARSRTMMFGGECSPPTAGFYPGDTWLLDGSAWLRAASEGPIGRLAAMAYDAKREVVVLHGGVGAVPSGNGPQPVFTDTWTWNGAAWRRAAEHGPPPRAAHAMTWDGLSETVLLYGGVTRDGELGDMWQWDGLRWAQVPLPETNPGPRQGHAMIYDPLRKRVVQYGGSACSAGGSQCRFLDDTWEWDGATWTQMK